MIGLGAGARAGVCFAATRTVARGEGLGARRGAARFGAEPGPASIGETIICGRAVDGASSSPLEPAAARSRLRPSSATELFLLHAAAPINAAIPAIRPARVCDIVMAILRGARGATERNVVPR